MEKTIELTKGKVSSVNEEDYQFINQYKWYASQKKLKTVEDLWYAKMFIKLENGHGTTKEMHRLIMERILKEEGNLELLKQFKEHPRKYPIDHIDGNGLKNTRNNLRIVSHRQNMQNLTKNNKTSGYPGVYWDKGRDKWAVYFRIGSKRKWVGRFDTEEEAFEEYKKAVKKYCNEDVIPELQ